MEGSVSSVNGGGTGGAAKDRERNWLKGDECREKTVPVRS